MNRNLLLQTLGLNQRYYPQKDMRDYNLKILITSVMLVGSLGVSEFASLSPARQIKADISFEPRPILTINVNKNGIYYSDDGANVFFINNQGKKRRLFKAPSEIKVNLSSVEPSAGKLFLFGPQDVLGFNINKGRKVFETRIERRGYVLSFHPMGNSKFILGVSEPGDGEALKIIDYSGKSWNLPKDYKRFISNSYTDIFVSSDRNGNLISVWDDSNGLIILDPLNGSRKFSCSNRQLSTYLSLPQGSLSISSMAFMKNRLVVCEYLHGKLLSINLKNPKDFKIFDTGLKSVMFMTKSKDEKSAALADSQGNIKIMHVANGNLKQLKSISLKSPATAMAWNTRSNEIIIGQKNGSLFRSAVQSP